MLNLRFSRRRTSTRVWPSSTTFQGSGKVSGRTVTVREPLGELVFVLEFALTANRRLARADPAVVLANLQAHGFHLQFPPTVLDPMVDG